MKLVRPEVATWISRWREALAAGALILFGLWVLSRGLARFNWIWDALGAVFITIGVLLLYNAIQRVRFAGGVGGPGLVDVTERRITYLAYDIGASVNITDMTRLEIRTNLSHGREWVLKQTEGPTVYIPIAAAGSDKLFDAFSSLPGIEVAKLIAAVQDGNEQREVIWRTLRGYGSLT